jgi:FMN phosphatase YigB (HAD superfamily)
VVERELAVQPTSCVLVGDHFVNDVTGAKRAGWSAIWLDRDRRGVEAWAVGDAPDATIASLSELPRVLDAWEAGTSG